MGSKLLRKIKDIATSLDAQIDEVLGKSKEVESLYEAAGHIIKAGGKRIRPFIVVKSCEMVGGDADRALPVAAGIELLHTFSLIHDDIMDQDTTRRGVASVHEVWGIPIAIAAGDFLFAKVYEAITRSLETHDVSARASSKILGKVTYAAIKMCEGQVLDLSFEDRTDAKEDDYFRVIEAKTAALFETSAEAGAMIGGGSERQVAKLGEYGFNAGIAFQIVDDILGVAASEKRLGKPVGSDIREGKMTLIIIHALRHCSSSEKARLTSVLGSRSASSSDIEEVINLVRSLGSIGYASQKALTYVAKAKQALDIFPPSEAKSDLIELANFFTAREY